MMDVIVRQETSQDIPSIFKVIKEAFKSAETPNPDEPQLVERLRKSNAFIPELSLVAIIDNQIVGHILLTKIKVNNNEQVFDSLALAPVSVLPQYKNRGIGGQLITKSHSSARQLGYHSIILLGHHNYYPRFGYKLAKAFGFKLPFDVPDENCMAIELIKDGLKEVNGTVEYPSAFFE